MEVRDVATQGRSVKDHNDWRCFVRSTAATMEPSLRRRAFPIVRMEQSRSAALKSKDGMQVAVEGASRAETDVLHAMRRLKAMNEAPGAFCPCFDRHGALGRPWVRESTEVLGTDR